MRAWRRTRGWGLVVGVTVAGAVVAARGAQLEWRDAKDWIKSLEDPARLAQLRVDERLAPLQLGPGHVVADIGAGTGVFSRAIARKVGPTGRVYAEDIQQGLVEYIASRAKAEGLANIVPVLGAFDDPRLPGRDVDLVFLHDVFHAIEHKERFLQALVTYLKPTARIAIVDWAKDDPAALKFHETLDILVSPEEATRLLAGVGFRPMLAVPGFSLQGIRQWYLVFERRSP
jgi:SAM-dependent methyltransferase